MIGPPPSPGLTGAGPASGMRACAVGEHAWSILAEVGRRAADIDALIAEAAVRQWDGVG